MNTKQLTWGIVLNSLWSVWLIRKYWAAEITDAMQRNGTLWSPEDW